MYYLQVPQLAVVNKIKLCYVLQAGLVFYIAGKQKKEGEEERRRERERSKVNTQIWL